MSGKKNLDMSFPLRDELRLHLDSRQMEILEEVRESWEEQIKRGKIDLGRSHRMVFFMKIVNQMAADEPRIAHSFVHDYLDSRRGEKRMNGDYGKLLGMMRRRFGRNFSWNAKNRSHRLVDRYLRQHYLTDEEKMDIYSGLLILDKMVVWMRWHEEHVLEAAEENARKLGVRGIDDTKSASPTKSSALCWTTKTKSADAMVINENEKKED